MKLRALVFTVYLFVIIKLAAQGQPKPADRFVDMIGVNVHFARNWTAYTNNAENPTAEQKAINALTSLRIRHVRDGIWGWNGGVEDFDKDGRGVVERFSSISQAGSAAGIPGGFTWILTDNTNDWKKLRDNYLVPLGNKVIVLEGANENMGVSGDAQAYTQIRNWWNNILPVMPHLKIATNTGPTNPCQIQNSTYIGDYVHYGNAHPYHFWPPFKPWGKVGHCSFNSTPAPPTTPLWTSPDNTTTGNIGFIEATRKKRIRPDQPMIFTEWGYPTISNDNNNWGVDEATAAKYILRSFLEHFNAGIVYSCSYELMDGAIGSTDPEHNFGLADYNGNLKQSGTALKRLIALLEDTGNTEILTTPLNYTLSDGGGLSFIDDKNPTTNEIHQTLLQKIDGTYYLILWQEAISTNSTGEGISVPSVSVTVNFDHTISNLKVYLPATIENASPILTADNATSLTISVPDHPVVIAIDDSQFAVAPASLTLAPTSMSVDIGGFKQITSSILPSTATNKNVTWISSNAAVATVNSAGIIKGISTGTAIISATTVEGGISSNSTVTVTSVTKVTGLTIKSEEVTLFVNDSKLLDATVFPETATNKSLVWNTSDSSIASVNQSGLVIATGVGIATISVKTVDGDFQKTCMVTANQVVTSADDEVIRSIISAYPNPVTNGKINFSGVTGSVSLKIYDVQGRVLFVKTVFVTDVLEIDDLKLNPGLYLLSIEDDKKVFKILVK